MIDPRASIHPEANIASNVSIGPWVMIEKNVTIGEGTIIGPHVVIQNFTRIGKYNRIFQFTSIGADPQDMKFNLGDETWLEIGDHNVIREFATINRGTKQGGGLTRIGDHNLLMAYSHTAHDCTLGDHTILGTYAGLAGHVSLQDWAILSGFVGVHQFCTIGAHSFIGNNCKITQDVLPYLMVAGGESPKPYGLNTEGLRRRGFSDETITELKKAYRLVFRQNLSVQEAMIELEQWVTECPALQIFIDDIKKSTRGFLR